MQNIVIVAELGNCGAGFGNVLTELLKTGWLTHWVWSN